MNDILTGMTRGLVRPSGKLKPKHKKSEMTHDARSNKTAPAPGAAALGSKGLKLENPRVR